MLFQNVQLWKRILSLLWLLGVALHISMSLAQAAGIKEKEINFADPFPQVVVGDSTELKVYGKDLKLLSVEITPPEGTTVSNIKETAPDPDHAGEQKAGVKVWTFKVSAHKGAQSGKRSLVLVSPKGHSEPQKIQYCTHTPKISDLTLLSASASSIKVQMLIADEAGDIEMGNNAPLSSGVTALFICLPSFITSISGGFKNVVKKDAQNFVVETVFSASSPNQFSEDCEMTLFVRDKEDAHSNKLKTKIKFK